MNKQLFERLSLGAIVLIALLLVLMMTDVIPPSLNLYIIFFAFILLALRLGFRLFFYLQDRKGK